MKRIRYCFLYVSSLLSFTSSHIHPLGSARTFGTALLAGLMTGILLSACTTDFEPEIDEPPLPVINVLAEKDSLLTAKVSRSWEFGSVSDPEEATLTDARVEYKIGDGDWHSMAFNEDTRQYESTHRAAEGERIFVRAATRYGEAEGWTEVPKVIPIEKVDYTVETKIDTNGMSIMPDGSWAHPLQITVRYQVTFTDPYLEDNYYMVSGNGYVDDPIIGENETSMDAVLNKYHYCSFFTDATIPGETYRLSLFSSVYLFPRPDGYSYPYYDTQTEINLIAISKDYYFYILSLFKKYTGLNGLLEDFGLAEPRSVFSNVTGGTGIVASDAVSQYTHDLNPIIQEVINNADKPNFNADKPNF